MPWLIWVALAASSTDALIWGASPPPPAPLDALAAGLGIPTLRPDGLAARVGAMVPRVSDPDAMRVLLRDAEEQEGRFNPHSATELRTRAAEIPTRAAQPSHTLMLLDARGRWDEVASALAEGRAKRARELAAEALAKYPSYTLDAVRYPPAVLELAEHTANEPGCRGTLSVQVTRGGILLLDGRDPLPVPDNTDVELPCARYTAWVRAAEGTHTWPRQVTVDGQPSSLVVDTELEWALRLNGPSRDVVLTQTELRPRLAQLLAPTRLWVAEPHDGDHVLVTPYDAHSSPRVLGPMQRDDGATVWAPMSPSAPPPRFSPLYLVPFGVGQWRQARPSFAIAYGAVQTGLLAWHIVAWSLHARAHAQQHATREPALRAQRNASGVALYTSLALGVAEAIVVGLATGE